MEGKMKKLLNERFQELAGIKPLNELETSPTELTDEEKDYVDDMMGVIKRKIVNSVSPDNKVEKTTALFKYIDGWFEVQGGTY
jgi:hypothetical protein